MMRTTGIRKTGFKKTGFGFLAILGVLLGLGLVTQPLRADFGTGWSAQYFANTNLSGNPVATASAPNGVNFTYGSGGPPEAPAVGVDNFTIRFSSVQLLNAGTYQFTISADDGARVIIDGQTVYDQFFGRPLTTNTFQLTFPTPSSHAITVEYLELFDQAIVQFQWQQVGGTVGTPSFGTPGFGTPGFFPTPFGTPPTTVGPTPTPTRVPNTPLPPIPPGALTGTVVRATVLLVRTGPFFGAPVASRILRGQTYQVIGRDPDARWFLLQLSQGTGWVWGYYLFVNGNEFNAPVQNAFVPLGGAAASTGVVGQTNAVLRLRAEPNAGSAQTGRIPWGDLLPILARTNTGWYQVVFRGTVGWVSSEFVNIVDGDVNVVPVQ